MTNSKSFLFCFVLLLSLLINSCQKDINDSNGGSPPPPSDLWGNSLNVTINGRVRDQNGYPVVGAKVTSGNSNTTSDIMGVFHLTNVSAYQRLAYVKVEKEGFFLGSRSFVPGNDEEVVDIKLLTKTVVGSVPATSGGTVNAQGVSITFSPNSVVRSNNAPHTGNVRVSLAFIDPTDIDFTREMPGNLLAVLNNQPRGLTSYGMVAVELSSGSGQPLQLAQGQTAEVRFPIPATQQSSAPAAIDLWSFDELNGYWKHEGQATKAGAEYVAQVSHFSFWNCDVPWDFVVLNGLVKDTNNQPVQGARVILSGSNEGSAYDITNTQGAFGGAVPANTTLTISVHISCGVSSTQVYSASIGPFSSTTTLSPITINPQGIINVTGTVLDCNNTPLANSYVVVGGQVVFSPAGQFSFHTCGTGNLSITSYGTSPWVAGSSQTVQLSGITVNAGNLQACSGGTTGTVTDVDGNSYNTVVIGNQEWMAENLKVSTYQNGDSIPSNLSNISGQSATSGAYTIYNNTADNDSIYGKLYNWYAVADPRGLCPSGWHVPSDAEWLTLEAFLGMPSSQLYSTNVYRGCAENVGGKMKAVSSLWLGSYNGATNSSGFTGLPGGELLSTGFVSLNYSGTWWSSTQDTSPYAWYRTLYCFSFCSFRNLVSKTKGLSVRCVKD